MKARLISLCGALFAVLLTAPIAPTAATAATAADVSRQDREYLNRAHQGNIFENVTGNLAGAKGLCPRVRDLGGEFAAHHLALDTDLIGVSARLGVTLNDWPDPGQLDDISELVLRTGTDFDSTWLRDQIAAHVQALELGDRELRYGWSDEVKQLALRSAPVLRQHLDETWAAVAVCTPA